MLKIILSVVIGLRCIARAYLNILKFPYHPIVIVSPEIMDMISQSHGFDKGVAKAAGFFPFVILRFKDHEMNDIRIRHESIHHYQQIESLGTIFIVDMLESLYSKVFLHKNPLESYLYAATEQEAYLNQEDESYLAKRTPFSTFHYIFFKTEFHLKDYRVVLD